MTNSNFLAKKYRTFNFKGRWADSFGQPEQVGHWLMYGTSGSGKTSLALQLAKYLTGFGRVLYWSIEQGSSAALQNLWTLQEMTECKNRIALADEGSDWDEIVDSMTRRRGFSVLIVDSLTPLRARNFNIIGFEKYRKLLSDKLVIWVSHCRQGLPDTKVGDYILKLADIKMKVEGFRVFVNSRSGKRFQDFVVWEQRAREYSINN